MTNISIALRFSAVNLGRTSPVWRCLECTRSVRHSNRMMDDSQPAFQRQEHSNRAIAVNEILCRVYPDRRPLLAYDSPFQLLIAVILSAQTTDAQVNTVTPDLFRHYPDPGSLSTAREADVEQLVYRTGFYRNKARNVIGAARAIVERFGGRVPEEMRDLVSIPGVGRKSANVIRGVVYHRPSIAVDTHLSRVTRRLGLVNATAPDAIERELRAIVPEPTQSDFSMAVNLHGRHRCHSRSPDCAGCEIAHLCPCAPRVPL